MNGDAALELLTSLLRTTLILAGPVLLVSLAAGVIVGIVQAATQVNEASISYVVKAVAVITLLVTLGPTLAAHVVTYARHNLEAVADVVH